MAYRIGIAFLTLLLALPRCGWADDEPRIVYNVALSGDVLQRITDNRVAIYTPLSNEPVFSGSVKDFPVTLPTPKPTAAFIDFRIRQAYEP